MNNLAFLTIVELQSLLKSGALSRTELIRFFIDRTHKLDPQIDALLEIFDEKSILAQGANGGLLDAIPGLIKDNICMQGRTASCASRILENFVATYDATVISRLKNAGALMLGRANMDEFAMGSSTETSAYKKTKNPWDVACVPGGSSGGSAAAVAAGFVPWALGSDTGGSVRQPAAFCGIVGMKPTYGRVSRYGLIAYGSSLDAIGVFSRTVFDNALIMSVIAGQDTHDSSSKSVAVSSYTDGLDGKIPLGLRIGIVSNALSADGMDDEVIAAIELAIKEIEKLGAISSAVTLPSLEYSAAAYFILSRAEAASNLARFDGVRYGVRAKKSSSLLKMYEDTRHDGFGFEVRKRILVGNYVLSADQSKNYYEKAQGVRQLICADFERVFKDVDLLIIPTHPAPAFKFGMYSSNKLQMDLQDYFTCPINLAGLPAISIPCGQSKSGMPIGFQLVGKHFAESLVYKVAHAYEQSTPWKDIHPKGF